VGYMKNLAPLQERTCSLGIHGEGEPTGQAVNPGSPGKWSLKRRVRVSMRVCTVYFFLSQEVVSKQDRKSCAL